MGHQVMTDAPVSALVVLGPAGGVRLAEEPVGAASLAAHLPDPETAERVRDWFVARGFEVGPVVGIAFSIVAPLGRMEEVFGGWEAHERGGEVPMRALPPDVAGAIRAVTTQPPPDFGPPSW